MLTCKICSGKFVSLKDHVTHQDLLHRVTSKTPIICGYKQCSCKITSLMKYHEHVRKFHSTSNDLSHQSLRPESAVSEDFADEPLLLKCAYPGCCYKCRSKSTLRSHHFWNHRGENSHVNPTPGTKEVEESISQIDPAPGTKEVGESSSQIDPAPGTKEVEESSYMSITAGDDNLVISDTDHTQVTSVPLQACVQLDVSCKSDILRQKFVHMGLVLTSKYHVPDSSLQYVLDTYKSLLHENASLQSDQLRKELSALGLSDPAETERIIESVVCDSALSKLLGPNGPMRTSYIRQQSYGKFFPYRPAKSVNLGLNNNNEKCKYHIVDLEESIQALFEDDSVYEQYLNSQRRSVLVGDLTDFHDGSLFKEHPLFSTDPSALQLIIFQDDIEILNGIGPAAGTFKLTHMSFTLGNLYPWNRSKVDPIQLLLLCKEKDVAYFGFPKVLEPLMKSLKNLEVNGINIRGKNVKAGVLVLLGDNLGTHTFCGFSEGFATGKYFCRYCEESREEWKKRWNLNTNGQQDVDIEDSNDSSDSNDDSDEESDEDSGEEIEGAGVEGNNESSDKDDVPLADLMEIDGAGVEGNNESSDEDDIPLADLIPLSDLSRQLRRSKAPLRTVESYNQCVEELAETPGGVRGVVGSCILNELENFHVVGGTPPCIGHDINEGVIPYDMLLCIKSLMKTYKFSYDYLNRAIKSFEFKGRDKLDKPPAKFHAQRKKVKGSAIQNWTFLRFLPLLLDSKVADKSNPVWVFMLTLIEVLRLLTSPIVSESVLQYVDNLIHKYLSLRAALFKVPFRCKHKYFEHYAYLTKRYGPLSKSSTLRFESKHAFFRSELRAKKCVKNVTKTLSKAHQLMQASLKIGQLFELRPVIVDAMVLNELRVDENVLKFIEATFGKEAATSMLYSFKMTVRNVEYAEGSVIVTSTSSYPRIECIKIKILISDGTVGYAVGLRCVGILLEDLQVFKLEVSALHTLIQLDTLKDYCSYPIYSHRQQQILVLKHLYLQK